MGLKREQEDRFREYTMNETTRIADRSYDAWIECKKYLDINALDSFANQIYLTYTSDIQYSDYSEKKTYWLEKFKNEDIIIHKFNS